MTAPASQVATVCQRDTIDERFEMPQHGETPCERDIELQPVLHDSVYPSEICSPMWSPDLIQLVPFT
jgi:hypothetical protein